MRDTFSSYHPIINFGYFTVVILITMFVMHPVFLAISFISAFIYSVFLNGLKALKFNLFFIFPAMVAVMLINPLFNHSGMTILFYLRDNPITLESIIYGICSGVMLASIILWFSCYNAVMTSDKFIYLFGKIIPSLSLLFSMVLRFVPKFKNQLTVVSNAQKCVGRDFSNGSFMERARHGTKILSVMITWALENSIETADSMRSRGYGLKGRTSFSIFRFDSRDKALFIFMIALFFCIIIGTFLDNVHMQFFPYIKLAEIHTSGFFVYLAYTIFCFIPIIINFKEELKWQHLKSKI